MAKCLVLGANGFLGSHIVDALVNENHTVVAFDKFGNLGTRFKESENVTLYNGDFLNVSDLKEALEGVEYVFHFISTTTPITSEDNPLIDVETNIKMTVELLQECVTQGVKKVIFASTGGAIYGSDSDHPLTEEDTPKPVSPYAIGKLTIEHYLRYFKVKHGLKSVSLRISNPYGERQPLNRRQGVIPIFLEHIYNQQPITVLGDGSMVRDYIYVKDLAKMISLSFEQDGKQDVYNLGSGQSVSISELVDMVQKVTEANLEIDHKPVPSTFVHKVLLDTSKFSEDFNLNAETSLEDGLSATWDYIQKESAKNAQ